MLALIAQVVVRQHHSGKVDSLPLAAENKQAEHLPVKDRTLLERCVPVIEDL